MDSELNRTMDGQTPNSPKRGLLKIVFIAIILVIVFGILNYFKILPISKLFPSQKSQPISTIEKATRTSFKIFCPSVKEFCEKGQGVIKDQKYIGLGYKLSSGSAIFAAFDGNLTATFSAYPIEVNGKTTQQNFKIVYLDNPSLNLRAIYFLRVKAKDIKTGKISKGEQIAVSGKPIAIYDNNSLIFSLIPGYPAVINTPAILNKEDFKH